jgi:YHS domain-containing protein
MNITHRHSEEEVVMKCIKTLSLAVIITLLMIGHTFSGENETKTISQKMCPVMTFGDLGCSVTKNDIHTDYKNKRIYFCSKGCREKFKNNPENYMKKLEEQGVTLENTPVKN